MGGDPALPAGRSATTAAEKPAVVQPRPGETLAAQVVEPVVLWSAPDLGSRIVAHVGRETQFDTPSVLTVVGRRDDWLEVLHESLGNGETGWVRASDVKVLREQWRIDVDLSRRRATLRRLGETVRTFPVAVGAPGTDTPPGVYGVTDRLTTGGPGSAYGCCVLALTGHQPDTPQDWPGGDRLAIHGTTAPESIGQAASHGCLRASEETMRLLMDKVPLGTQVRIVA